MIAKLLLMATSISALLLTGCGQIAPELDDISVDGHGATNATEVARKTVSINDSVYGNENSNNGQNGTNGRNNIDGKNAMSGQNSANDRNHNSNSSKYNSSSNGFHSIYFGFGYYNISPKMENYISSNANVAQKNRAKVKIEGNCDEFGTDEYNYALGLKRAKAVKDSLVAQGVSSTSMVIISYGESNPICSSPTDGCYAQNRRVDLRLAR